MRLLICLSNAQLTIVITEGRRLLRRLELDCPFTLSDVVDTLNDIPGGVAVELVVDLIDEDRFTESVARVMPWEQDTLLKRMLRRRKGSEALLYTRWVGSEKTAEGRVEKQAQVVGLSDTRLLEILMAAMEKLTLNVGHIHSLSELVATACTSRKGDADKADILLTKTAENTYRQILVVAGVARLSRQVLLASDDPAELREEQAGFERFIMVQRLVPFGQSFRYTLVGWDRMELARLRDACRLDDQTEVVETAVGLSTQGNAGLLKEHPALALILNHFTRGWPGSHYKPAPYLAMRKQHLTRRGLWLSSLALVLGGSLLGVSLAVKTLNHQSILMDMSQLERRYMLQARAYEARANLPARADDVRDSTEFVESVLAQRDQPGLAVSLINISQVFKQYPEFRLKSVRWERPELHQLARQKLVLGLSIITLPETSLQDLSGRLAAVMQAVMTLPGVETADRGDLAIDAKNDSDLSISLAEQEGHEHKFEVSIELNYETEDS